MTGPDGITPKSRAECPQAVMAGIKRDGSTGVKLTLSWFKR